MKQSWKIAVMVFVFAVCGGAVFLHQNQTEPQDPLVKPGDLYDVIYTQLGAFREADFSRAYRQASTGFQHKWNVDQFAETVRNNYSAMVLADRIEFGPVHVRGDRAMIQVFFINPAGEVLPCVYSMIREGDTWKIDGAHLLAPLPAGRRLRGLRS